MRVTKRALVCGVGMALVAAVAGFTASPASAATVTVTTTTDGGAGSLRAAVDAANAVNGPTTIELGVAQTYNLTICGAAEDDTNVAGDLDLTSTFAVTITGNGSTIHQTCTDRRVLDHRAGTLTLDTLTISGGNGQPDGVNNGSLGLGLRSVGVQATNVSVTGNNGPAGSGSAVATAGSASSTFTSSTVSDNGAAGIYDSSSSGSLSVLSSHVDHNAGIAAVTSASGITVLNRTLVLHDSSVDGNAGPGQVIPPPSGSANNCSCAVVGGVFAGGLGTNGALDGARNAIRNNVGQKIGGVASRSLHDEGSHFEENWGSTGGGVSGVLDLHGSTIRANHSSIGGGFLASGGLIEASTIVGNEAKMPSLSVGGGGFVGGALTIRRSTITGNHAAAGGGLAVDAFDVASQLTLDGVTLVENGPVGPNAGEGSQLWIYDGPVASSVSSTRSVIGGPAGATPACERHGRPVVSTGYNFTADSSCFSATMATDSIGGGDPLLGPLADHGGDTETRLPLSGSPVVDKIPPSNAGCAGQFDQREVARPQGPACDIGAAEAKRGGYHPVTPVRLLDTRDTHDPLTEATTREVTLPSPVPTTGAAAVVLNVTVTNASVQSHLTVWPSGRPLPATSNLNFDSSHTIANLVTVATTDSNKISLRNNTGTTDVIVDFAGWYDTGEEPCPCGDGFTAPVNPVRILDTRQTGGPLDQFETRSIPVTGVLGIPVIAEGIVANLTVTDTTKASHLTAGPSGAALPVVSNLNWPAAGFTIANGALLKLGQGGRISLHVNSGSANVIVDVLGWFTSGPSGKRFTAVTPSRIVDNRPVFGTNTPLGPGETRTVASPAIPDGTAAAVINLTGFWPDQITHLTAWPTGQPVPATSTLNMYAAYIRPNLTTVGLNPNADFNVRNNAGTISFFADLYGYYS